MWGLGFRVSQNQGYLFESTRNLIRTVVFGVYIGVRLFFWKLPNLLLGAVFRVG